MVLRARDSFKRNNAPARGFPRITRTTTYFPICSNVANGYFDCLVRSCVDTQVFWLEQFDFESWLFFLGFQCCKGLPTRLMATRESNPGRSEKVTTFFDI